MNKRMRCINVESGFVELKPKIRYEFKYGSSVNSHKFVTYLGTIGLPATGNYSAHHTPSLGADEITHKMIEEYEFAT